MATRSIRPTLQSTGIPIAALIFGACLTAFSATAAAEPDTSRAAPVRCGGVVSDVIQPVKPGADTSVLASRTCSQLGSGVAALPIAACSGSTTLIGKGWDQSGSLIYQACGSSGPCNAAFGHQVSYAVANLQAANDRIFSFTAFNNCNAALYRDANFVGTLYNATPSYSTAIVNPGISSIRWYGR